MSLLRINKGTTYTITYNHKENGEAKTLAGATVRFTVKDEEWDTDATDAQAQIVKNITSHTDASAGVTTIALTPTDTDLTPATYYYDIKVQDSDGNIYKTVEGKVKIDGSPTNRTS